MENQQNGIISSRPFSHTFSSFSQAPAKGTLRIFRFFISLINMRRVMTCGNRIGDNSTSNQVYFQVVLNQYLVSKKEPPLYTRLTSLCQLPDHHLLTLLFWAKRKTDIQFSKILHIMNNFKAINKETLLALFLIF